MTGAIPPAEQLAAQLRALYQRYGFKHYRVSKFEEYDLYARNKRFLTSPHILTFSDTNGRLMALKPDITLSIINNTRDDDRTRKVWYTENVYRVPRGGSGFQEIMQAGLEMLGAVDLYAMGEVLMLAARSLEAVSPRYVLELSHMGILTGVLDTLAVPAGAAEAILPWAISAWTAAITAAGSSPGPYTRSVSTSWAAGWARNRSSSFRYTAKPIAPPRLPIRWMRLS